MEVVEVRCPSRPVLRKHKQASNGEPATCASRTWRQRGGVPRSQHGAHATFGFALSRQEQAQCSHLTHLNLKTRQCNVEPPACEEVY